MSTTTASAAHDAPDADCFPLHRHRCGEHFPRGRLDSLTTHLTKKCPAIGEADRVNAIFTLSGMSHASHRLQQTQHNQGQVQPPLQNPAQVNGVNGSTVDLPMIQRDLQRDWTALGVLAEVSRQIDMSEKNDDRVPLHPPVSSGTVPGATTTQSIEHFVVQDQGNVENPHQADEHAVMGEQPKPEPVAATDEERVLTTEERIHEILRAEEQHVNADASNISMAAAAAARLHPALLDPQLLGQEAAAAAEAASATAAAAAAVASSLSASEQAHQPHQSPPEVSPSIPTTTPSQPWGEITYTADAFQAIPTGEPVPHATASLTKGGFRLETTSKARHSRARFNATRRKQVQEVRKIGACIRCRVLRKTCSPGEPCDTCRKVLSPRVWRSGCVRTKFSEQLDLYSAGVQIVLAQGRINTFKQAMVLSNHGLVIEASHFPELSPHLRLQVLQRDGIREADGKVTTGVPSDKPLDYPIIMVDNDSQDVPARLESYMREVLPELIKREPSHFMQVTLQTALEIASTTNDELLKKSLELWGLVEILDRERQWTITVKSTLDDTVISHIKEETHEEVFTTICLQLAAAAERKAAATSKTLLTGMQRVLQDSKVKIDFGMYFATLILLNCVEKSTWAFKAWEQPNLRTMWPLEKDPGSFAQQGYVIADLLRMLLTIRKALPRTAHRESDGKLVTEEQDPAIKAYFEAISLNFAQIKSKQEQPVFSPTDPRSFEFLFSSTLLLPAAE
ncbi:hypothetical protein B0T20DRAFT_477979 [Sordaria brevicollis]|uniref:Zn(2)-C6 fungal-type domain-containing protein n=1 Tax=Sordaria brevicollis TaxID=83679 RepID=A0AAE0PHQ4_SORBR|nr:hypothetical protein B0T20DRAFT_477979 [Sordaria brevicollis]